MSADLLRNVYLFKNVPEAVLTEISQFVESKTYSPGEVVFNEGDKADSLYVVEFGSVRVSQRAISGDKLEIAVLGNGSHFGEMSFVDGEPRSATIEAIDKTGLLKIPFSSLESYIFFHQDVAATVYKEMSIFLCGRLRTTTQDLSFARQENIAHF